MKQFLALFIIFLNKSRGHSNNGTVDNRKSNDFIVAKVVLLAATMQTYARHPLKSESCNLY